MKTTLIAFLTLLSGCAPHSPTVPTQTNVVKGYWPPPRNPPVMVFTNAPEAPAPMRAVSQSMKTFVAVPQTNSPWTSNMLWVIHTRCGLDPQDHSRTNLIAVLVACDPEFYYRGMAHGPILFKVLGLDTNSFQRGYLNVPVIIRHSTNHGESFSFFTVTTNGMFWADPTNASDWFEALWSMDNFKTVNQ